MPDCLECEKTPHAKDCTKGKYMGGYCIHCEENRVKVAFAPYCSKWCEENHK